MENGKSCLCPPNGRFPWLGFLNPSLSLLYQMKGQRIVGCISIFVSEKIECKDSSLSSIIASMQCCKMLKQTLFVLNLRRAPARWRRWRRWLHEVGFEQATGGPGISFHCAHCWWFKLLSPPCQPQATFPAWGGSRPRTFELHEMKSRLDLSQESTPNDKKKNLKRKVNEQVFIAKSNIDELDEISSKFCVRYMSTCMCK